MTDHPTPPPPPSSQLRLPLNDLLANRRDAPGIPRQNRVFCNRNLKLSNVHWVGFDMDYTLAIYDQRAMDELSISATMEKLVKRGYPEIVKTVKHPIDFPVRGLLIDKKHGHILKMDRYKFVNKAFHGTRELSQDQIKELYHAKKLRPATARHHFIDTLYALSEVACYAAVVDAMEASGFAIDYAQAFADIRECIDEAHRDGTILDAVAADLPKYVNKDPQLAVTLHKFRSAGKKLFLLTNSRWAYTDKLMTYLLGGAMTEYPSWRNYFDIVIVAASKPAFFQERRPLFEREGNAVRMATLPLERGRVYEGGNLMDFEHALGVPGDEVLYVGDHIYGDILRSKKDSAWRTAMIIQELEHEVSAYERCKKDYGRLEELDEARSELEDELRFYQGHVKDIGRRLETKVLKEGEAETLEAERMRIKRAIERIRGRLKEIDAEARALDRAVDERFHPYWGSLLKQGREQSSFGKQVDDYACVYTSRVSNFFGYSPQQYFRSPRDFMAHELD